MPKRSTLSWLKVPSSTLPEDRAPSAFRDNLKDQTAPTHPGAPREQLEACRALSSPPRAAPKMRVLPLSTTRHLTPIEERIKDLHESMNAVRDMQDQMREQDEAHHKMTRSTRSRLLWCASPRARAAAPAAARAATSPAPPHRPLSLVPRFTIAEAVVLVAVSMWQILYLKSFFEVKRVV